MAAAVPQSLVETAERKPQGPASHGRGGAGNFGVNPADAEPVTLETPTIKSDVYTTGRGGSGNMAKNTDPEEARRAQDVTGTVPQHDNAPQHVGRGGGGNVFKPQEGAGEKKTESKGILGLAEKGREFLFGKK